MKITATNIGQPVTISWNGQTEQTGIYKYPTTEPLFLGNDLVKKDTVIDRKHHGGEFKACYLFAEEEYAYWKELYPELDWDWGMFGENLTVQGLNEAQLRIGTIYTVGNAKIQVTIPREPCYKLGIRFKNQEVVRQFLDRELPGTYVKVLEEGTVKAGDELELVEEPSNPLTVSQYYRLLFAKQKDKEAVALTVEHPCIPQYKRDRLRKFL